MVLVVVALLLPQLAHQLLLNGAPPIDVAELLMLGGRTKVLIGGHRLHSCIEVVLLAVAGIVVACVERKTRIIQYLLHYAPK